MKAAYLIIARNKAAHVERCVRAALAQTGCVLEVVLSDQGSTDGTREILGRLAAEYEGPHTVRVLDCPHTDTRGMAGMNAHLAWVNEQMDADIVIVSSADDYSLPERSARTIEAFEATGADMVYTACRFEEPDGTVTGFPAYQQDGWVTVKNAIDARVGGSGGMAWRRSFWKQAGPIPELCGMDVYLTPLACSLGGFWFVKEPLHVYVNHADPNNTGLEGVLRALPKEEHAPTIEHMHFQIGGCYYAALERMTELGVGNCEDIEAMTRMGWAQFGCWLKTRTLMTLERMAPKPFPI